MPLERHHTRRLAFPLLILLLLFVSLSLCYSLLSHTFSLDIAMFSLCEVIVYFVSQVLFVRLFGPTISSTTFHPHFSLLFFSLLPPDCLLCLKRSHPTGYWIYCWQPQLQARERCADAGLLCGRKRLLSQVGFYMSGHACVCICVWEVSNPIIFILFSLLTPPYFIQ